MQYQQIIEDLESKHKRRISGFIHKYYIENKSIECIMEEMYIDTKRGFYCMKRRARKIIQEYIDTDKLVKMQ